VGHLVPAGSVYSFLAGHRRRLFPDELFSDLFPSARGRPSVPADVVATVMVLQALEGLSDRDAIDSLRTDIKWKVAAVNRPGFLGGSYVWKRGCSHEFREAAGTDHSAVFAGVQGTGGADGPSAP
jgi:hypothetical protein